MHVAFAKGAQSESSRHPGKQTSDPCEFSTHQFSLPYPFEDRSAPNPPLHSEFAEQGDEQKP
jgi:hypothetical protein